MEFLSTLVDQLNEPVWGPPMLAMILGIGFVLILRSKLMPPNTIGTVLKQIWQKCKQGDEAGPVANTPPHAHFIHNASGRDIEALQR
ncbi:hypothetical protein D9M68_747960 [compost metagenome]